MAVWRTQINYLGAALAGDRIEIATWPVYNDGRLRIDRRFQIRRQSDGETLLRALLHYVCIELTSGKPRRMPPEFVRYQVAADRRGGAPTRDGAVSAGCRARGAGNGNPCTRYSSPEARRTQE